MQRIFRTFNVLCIIVAGMLLIGCQQEEASVQIEEENTIPSVPYSKGPSAPPNVKGPDIPLPGESGQPQAVTEVEEIRYSLPGDSSPEFKQ